MFCHVSTLELLASNKMINSIHSRVDLCNRSKLIADNHRDDCNCWIKAWRESWRVLRLSNGFEDMEISRSISSEQYLLLDWDISWSEIRSQRRWAKESSMNSLFTIILLTKAISNPNEGSKKFTTRRYEIVGIFHKTIFIFVTRSHFTPGFLFLRLYRRMNRNVRWFPST